MATKFYSRKQAGVIYRNVKSGTIKMDKDAVSAMYDYADTTSTRPEDAENAKGINETIRAAVDAIFSNDTDKAQIAINDFVSVISDMYASGRTVKCY